MSKLITEETLAELYADGSIKTGTVVEIFKRSKDGSLLKEQKCLSNDLGETGDKYLFVRYLAPITEEFNSPDYCIEVTDNVPSVLKEFAEKYGKDFDYEYALPEQKKYPLYDEKHVRSAIKLFNAGDLTPAERSTVAHKILAKMKKYGISTDTIGEDNKLGNYLKEDAEVKGEDHSTEKESDAHLDDTKNHETYRVNGCNKKESNVIDNDDCQEGYNPFANQSKAIAESLLIKIGTATLVEGWADDAGKAIKNGTNTAVKATTDTAGKAGEAISGAAKVSASAISSKFDELVKAMGGNRAGAIAATAGALSIPVALVTAAIIHHHKKKKEMKESVDGAEWRADDVVTVMEALYNTPDDKLPEIFSCNLTEDEQELLDESMDCIELDETVKGGMAKIGNFFVNAGKKFTGWKAKANLEKGATVERQLAYNDPARPERAEAVKKDIKIVRDVKNINPNVYGKGQEIEKNQASDMVADLRSRINTSKNVHKSGYKLDKTLAKASEETSKPTQDQDQNKIAKYNSKINSYNLNSLDSDTNNNVAKYYNGNGTKDDFKKAANIQHQHYKNMKHLNKAVGYTQANYNLSKKSDELNKIIAQENQKDEARKQAKADKKNNTYSVSTNHQLQPKQHEDRSGRKYTDSNGHSGYSDPREKH
jgi:hypothetical protein